MVMFDGKTKPEEIIRLVYKKIDECGGLYKAFLVSETGDPYSGCTLLYSGPNREFFENLDPTIPKKIVGPIAKPDSFRNKLYAFFMPYIWRFSAN